MLSNMKGGILARLTIGFWITLFAIASAPARADDAEDALVKSAGEIPFVSYHDFLYGSAGYFGEDQKDGEAANVALERALKVTASFEQLARLAAHPESRVRTLALMKLYALESRASFGIIYRCQSDTGAAFPDATLTYSKNPSFETKPLTVGNLSTRMLKMIGYITDYRDLAGPSRFQEWSNEHLESPESIGWYEFLYTRATEGTHPGTPNVDKITALKKEMEGHRFEVRAWMWLGHADEWLDGRSSDTLLATEAEMVEAAKKLGSTALLAYLRDGTRTGLKQPQADERWRGKHFILSHARQLFREEDAETLANLGQFIAAADVLPARASEFIRRGFRDTDKPYYSSRAEAMAALLDLQTDAETDFAVKWFIDARTVSNGPDAQKDFLLEYLNRKPAGWRKPVSLLVAHPTFEQLNPDVLTCLAGLVNSLDGTPVIQVEPESETGEMEIRNLLRRYFGLEEVLHPTLETPALKPSPPVWTTRFEGEATSLSTSPDGELIAVGRSGGNVLLFHSETGKAAGELPSGETSWPIHFRDPDGALIVIARNGEVMEWDVRIAKPTRKYELRGLESPPCDYFTFSKSGDLMACRGHKLEVFENGIRRWFGELQTGRGGFLALSPDGGRLAVSAGLTNRILLFDPSKPELIAQSRRHSGIPRNGCFSPDGKYLVTTGMDTKVIVWDGATGEVRQEFHSRHAGSGSIAFTSDSTGFFVATDEGRISLIDLATGQARQVLEVPQSYLWKSEVSKDGRRLTGYSWNSDREGKVTSQLSSWTIDPGD